MDQGILLSFLLQTSKPTLAVRVWISTYQTTISSLAVVGIKYTNNLILYNYLSKAQACSLLVLCIVIAGTLLFVCRRKSNKFGQPELLLFK